MIRAPFPVNLVLTLGLVGGCVYFWGFSNNPGAFVASAFLLMGLAQYGTHLAMDIRDRLRK